MKKIMKLGLILLIFTALAAGILALLNQSTKDIIAESKIQESNEARQEVLPTGKEFKELDESEFKKLTKDSPTVEEIYTGLEGEEVIGYTIKTALSGYSGPVIVMTGINTEGIVTGMKVVSNTETPGLGANSSTPEFQDQYKDQSAEKEIELVKTSPAEGQVQALTGATITSKTVTDSVNEAIKIFRNISK